MFEAQPTFREERDVLQAVRNISLQSGEYS